MLTVTALYAGILALLLVSLSARVILYRRANRVGLGDAGDRVLLRRVRAQANCAEYAPIGLLLLGIAELNGAPVIALHVLGLMLVTGRLLHAVGFGREPETMSLRVAGMGITLTMLIVTAIGLIAHSLL